MKNDIFTVAVVGASGAVGRELLKVLDQRQFPISQLKLFSSSRSAGQALEFVGKSYVLTELTSDQDFHEVDIAFFTAGSSVSEKYAKKAAQAGAVVIDLSSFFRMHPEVPLVVPEVNGDAIEQARNTRLIANPNCTTSQLVMVLKPLHDHFKIKRVVLSSYQAVSGKGQKGIDEFTAQIHDFIKGHELKAEAFPHPIAFNCIPHIDDFHSDGFTGEEHKVMNETKKILEDSTVRVVATCVRVPVMNGHSESVTIETEKPITIAQAKAVLEKMPGVKLCDDPTLNQYPLASKVSGTDEVYVGRMRQDPSLETGRYGLTLWIVADNFRKGAALNAVQIAEAVVSRGMMGHR